MTFQSDIWLLLWIGLVALVAYSAKLKRKETVLGQETERYSLLFAVITFLPVIWYVCFSEVRADGVGYVNSFLTLNSSITDVIQKWGEIKAPGFRLINVLIKNIFGNNQLAFRVIIALIQSIPVVLICRKYSEDYIMSVFMFITMGTYTFWMMNGIRQFVAVCIIFAATPLLIKGKIVPTILIILLAMTIHVTAVMMIPIVLVVRFEPWKKKIIICFIVFVIALFIFVNVTDLLDEEIKNTDNGANPLRIVFSAIPCVIAFIGRKKIAAENNMMVNICINMSMFATLTYFVATFTNGIGTGRLPIYTSVFNFILIPYLCIKVFNESISKKLRVFFIGYYIASYFVEMIAL